MVEEGGQTAGEVEVFHEEASGGPEIGEARGDAGNLIESFEGDFDSGASCHSDEVHDGVGGTSDGHIGDDGVVERFGVEEGGGFQVGPDVLDDLASAFCGHVPVGGVGGGDGRCAGKGDAEGFGDGGHGGRGAHRHAVPVGAGDAGLDFAPLGVTEIAGATFGPVFPSVRAGA